MSLPIRMFTEVCFIVTDYPWQCSFETTFAVHWKEMPAYIRSLKPCVAACVCAKLIFECCPDTSWHSAEDGTEIWGPVSFLSSKTAHECLPCRQCVLWRNENSSREAVSCPLPEMCVCVCVTVCSRVGCQAKQWPITVKCFVCSLIVMTQVIFLS